MMTNQNYQKGYFDALMASRLVWEVTGFLQSNEIERYPMLLQNVPSYVPSAVRFYESSLRMEWLSLHPTENNSFYINKLKIEVFRDESGNLTRKFWSGIFDNEYAYREVDPDLWYEFLIDHCLRHCDKRCPPERISDYISIDDPSAIPVPASTWVAYFEPEEDS